MNFDRTETNLETLAARIGLGAITRCSSGCIHVAVGATRLSLNETQFWGLVDMVYQSGRKLASRSVRRQRRFFE